MAKIKVRAKRMGFYGKPGRRYREGDTLVIEEREFSALWMEHIGGKAEKPEHIKQKIQEAEGINVKLGRENFNLKEVSDEDPSVDEAPNSIDDDESFQKPLEVL